MAKISFVDRYCRRVRQFLICRPEIREHILNDLRCDLEEYVERHPEATEDQLIEKFGKPESYAKAYLSTLDDDEFLTQVKIGSFRKKLWIILAAAIAVAVAATLIGMILHNNQHMGQYYTESVVTTDTLE